jgi:hypothetical protein
MLEGNCYVDAQPVFRYVSALAKRLIIPICNVIQLVYLVLLDPITAVPLLKF